MWHKRSSKVGKVGKLLPPLFLIQVLPGTIKLEMGMPHNASIIENYINFLVYNEIHNTLNSLYTGADVDIGWWGHWTPLGFRVF